MEIPIQMGNRRNPVGERRGKSIGSTVAGDGVCSSGRDFRRSKRSAGQCDLILLEFSPSLGSAVDVIQHSRGGIAFHSVLVAYPLRSKSHADNGISLGLLN